MCAGVCMSVCARVCVCVCVCVYIYIYIYILVTFKFSSNEGNVLFNDALNTFYLRLYRVRHISYLAY